MGFRVEVGAPFRAGMVGDADTALFVSDAIAAPEARAGALAQCARAAFEAIRQTTKVAANRNFIEWAPAELCIVLM